MQWWMRDAGGERVSDSDLESLEEGSKEGGLMSRIVGGLLEKTVRQSGFRNEVDRYIDGKREQTLQAARDEADGFLEDWLARIERRIDHKMVEIEVKIDEQIEKELRAKIWILILTLVTVVGMSVVSLGYFWLKGSGVFPW